MKYFLVNLNEIYPEISQFPCNLKCFLPDNFTAIEETRKRPAVLIMPGGGYGNLSDRESEPVALRFLGEGFGAFILEYSVASNSTAKFPCQLLQACFAMKYIRDNAGELNISERKVFAAGFSAGGHLCASLGLLYDSAHVTKIMPDYDKARPDALILCYPVISSGKYAHKGSFANLLDNKAFMTEVSLENAVKETSPPAFIWHTFNDEAVPVFNPLLLAEAYAEKKASMELHIFEKGVHGLSLADWRTAHLSNNSLINANVSVWFDLMLRFLKDKIT